MKKLLTSILVLGVILLAFTTLGFSASDSATVSVSWTVEAQQSLNIVSTNPTLSSSSSSSVTSVIDVPEPKKGNIGDSIQKDDAIKLEASSNTEWEVQVEAENSFHRSTKGYVDLSVRADNNSFEQVTTDPTTIASGEPGTHQFGVDYRFNYDEDYESGDYKIKLTYTITTP